MSGHTPGPWLAVEAAEDCPWPVGVPIAVHCANEPWRKAGRICEMVAAAGPEGRYSHEATEANAILIAAAPALLEACRQSRRCGHVAGVSNCLDIACAAVGKAEGAA